MFPKHHKNRPAIIGRTVFYLPSDDTEKALSDIHGKGGETRIPFPPRPKPFSRVKADRGNGSPVSKAFPARKRLRGNGYPRIVILSGGKSKKEDGRLKTTRSMSRRIWKQIARSGFARRSFDFHSSPFLAKIISHRLIIDRSG